MPQVTRRTFLETSSAVAAGLAAASVRLESTAAADRSSEPVEFRSRWDASPDRVWLGAEYWANPLQDWQVAKGRIECVNPALDRNVHLLTRQLANRAGEFQVSVRLGRVDGPLGEGRGSAGFRVGIQGPLDEYRNSLIFGSGLNAGVTADGRLFIGELPSPEAVHSALPKNGVQLRLAIRRDEETDTLTLTAHDPDSGDELGRVSREGIPPARLVGNIAIVANFGTAQRGRPQPKNAAGTGRFWFADWRLAGERLEAHDDRAFGPILFSQYTLSDGVLALTAQMPPVGAEDSQTVTLEIETPDGWKPLGEEPIHPQARTATFRIEDWDATKDVPYRLRYASPPKNPGAGDSVAEWHGTIRRDPVDRDVLTVADISCNIHAAFPNHEYVANVAKTDPDLIAFTGDQFYESTGGYGVVRTPLDTAILDYLRKWYLHGWTWRDLTRDRPSISIPDDHDVYQGNVWGAGGAGRQESQAAGGYDMHPEWVNVVHRTQTSHHPKPHDPTPIKQDITVYYGPMTYGRISFAVLADRMFKTGPEGIVPPTGSRGDHVVDPNFDPKTANVEGAELLGGRQMKFLRDWITDWRGADMKAVVSQTIFTAMATTHGTERQRLRADYDTNGWPQTPRNDALRLIRKVFAVHLAGDQHLPALVHYGIDEHRDAGVAFAGPAVNVGYPRWWEPAVAGKNRAEGASELTGDFIDHFGHPLTVLAVKNGAAQPRRGVIESLTDKASGYGLVRFDKRRNTVTFECWPFLADPTKDAQFEGWPVTVSILDNYGRRGTAHLPTLEFAGDDRPVVEVIAEADGDLVYALRAPGPRFQPHVFAPGKYTVRISRPEQGTSKELTGLEASTENNHVIRVKA